MKYLGVDYGKKNIGLAISDSEGKVAMPFGIFENNKNFLETFLSIIEQEKIEAVVFGQSLNLEGEENKINQEIKNFAENIKQGGKASLLIFFQDERFTSMQSKWGTEKNIRRPEKKPRGISSNKKIDDKAATLILQSFLDKNIT